MSYEADVKKLTGYEAADLSAAFNLVANPKHWKDPIDAVINADKRDIVVAAVEFYTATKAHVLTYIIMDNGRLELPEGKLEALELFNDGLTLYKRGDFANARDIFQKALEVEPDDGPSKTYIERCSGFIENPTGEDWDGGWTLTEK